MRTYGIDQLELEECRTIARHLSSMELQAGLEGLFWLPVPAQLLTSTQQNHHNQCGPYALALEVEDDAIRLELLVRARNAMRCECITPASSALREHMINYLDDMLRELNIVA